MAATLLTHYTVLYSSNQFPRRIGLMAGDEFVGQVVFHPDGATLPEDALQDGQPQLHMHLADYANVMDLLRNERPVELIFSGEGGSNENVLRAHGERVGEGESRRR